MLHTHGNPDLDRGEEANKKVWVCVGHHAFSYPGNRNLTQPPPSLMILVHETSSNRLDSNPHYHAISVGYSCKYT
jgi:hypothetical protein